MTSGAEKHINSNSTFSENSDQWRCKGRKLMEDGHVAEAINAFDKAIRLSPSCSACYFHRGVCHYMLGRYRSAARDMKVASIMGCDEALLWSSRW